MAGIENLKAIVAFAAKNETLIGKLVDGGITKDDLILVPEFMIALPDLIQIHWSELLPEAKDLTIEECQELIATHNAAFSLPDKKVEATIEETLVLVAQVSSIVFKLIALFKKTAA
jgi:hypothetical protein